jgi:DNA-binding NtrC family response regulator
MNVNSILIIEDEEIIRSLYKRILTPMGHKPVFATTLSEGRQKLLEAASLDLLISDICLPDGRGTDIIDLAREKFPAAKVLIITGLPPGELDSGTMKELGLEESDMIFKPVKVDVFEAEVRKRLADTGREE